MRTHENADGSTRSVDFEYNTDLRREGAPLNVSWPFGFGTVYCNGSPLQAFRSAFRAAARLCLGRGPVEPERMRPEVMSPINLHWLLVWCSIGADAPNGAWCLYGARLGCFLVGLTDWDYRTLNDFGRLAGLWREEVAPRFRGEGARCPLAGFGWDPGRLDAEIAVLGDALRRRFGLPAVELDAAASRFFKQVYEPPLNGGSFDALGNMFRRGIGAGKNAEKALLSYGAGTAVGHTNAMNSLARMLRAGDGCARDVDRAVHLLREATALGNAFAPHELARMYRRGWGVERSPGRALELFRLAAGRGVAAAEREIAEMMSGDAAAE
jgi:TPR repeat protein